MLVDPALRGLGGGGGVSGTGEDSVVRTCTLNTPQTGSDDTWWAFLKIPAGSSRLPCTTLILGDLSARFLAALDCGLRVTARISMSASSARRALTTAPPCLPVAPVTRIDFIFLRLNGGSDWWMLTSWHAVVGI